MDKMYEGYGQITGPNNAKCVVWAIGIFFSLWVFYILTIFMYSICLIDSALKSGLVSILLPFLEGPQTGLVPESFRMQEPWTGTAKKPQKTGCNWL